MQPLPSSNFAFAQLTGAVVVLASLLAVRRIVNSPDDAVMVCIVGLLIAVVLGLLVEWMVALPCPACSRRTLRPIARHTSYFRCSACRARFKWFGADPGAMHPAPMTRSGIEGRGSTGHGRAMPHPKTLMARAAAISFRGNGPGTCWSK